MRTDLKSPAILNSQFRRFIELDFKKEDRVSKYRNWIFTYPIKIPVRSVKTKEKSKADPKNKYAKFI